MFMLLMVYYSDQMSHPFLKYIYSILLMTERQRKSVFRDTAESTLSVWELIGHKCGTQAAPLFVDNRETLTTKGMFCGCF